MRTVFVMTTDYKIQGEYGIRNFYRALDDIEGNGCSAVDIKFDFDGDIIILIASKLKL